MSIGSTRKRQYHGTVRSDTLGNELLGRLGLVRFDVNGSTMSVLTQILSVDRRNPVHEDPRFGPVVACKGSIPHLSAIGDYEEAVAKPVAQQLNGQPAPLRANPPSGTPVVSLDDPALDGQDNSEGGQAVFNGFSSEKPQYLRYAGNLMNESVCLPFIFKSFDPKDKNGFGEARHAGFFAATGKGKTHAAKITLGLALSATPGMGAFIPDAKGDFVQPSERDMDLRAFLEANGRKVNLLNVEQLRLEDAEDFSELLQINKARKAMLIGNPEKFSDLLEMALLHFAGEHDKLKVTGDGAITLDKLLESFNDNILKVYAGSDRENQKKTEKARDVQRQRRRQLENIFEGVLARFTQGTRIDEMIDSVLQKSCIYFLHVPKFNDPVTLFLLEKIYRRFKDRAGYHYHTKGYSNAIVYVDEANRFVPQSPTEERKELARELIDGIKTTRQYGLGWWFADQRPASISKDIFTQLGTYFFGKGMSAAADKANVESIIGKEGLDIYENMSTARPFLVTGQMVGVGGEDNVPLAMSFFGSWPELSEPNNRDFDANFEAVTGERAGLAPGNGLARVEPRPPGRAPARNDEDIPF
ncbi:ATP-binding protein [Gloeobacter morelensis]|nr:DUF87 domain-containing protein [Gloeobacter morelensis]